MGEMKHTPGPWVVGPVDDTVVTHLGKDGRRYEIAQIDGDYNSPDEWPVMEANARLIATAPDLLRELIDIHRLLCEVAPEYAESPMAVSARYIIARAKAPSP